ncbi:flagellar motor switch protein FliM [Salirhabdus salicampi]|uniref:flagellar motor switch protein FliM n=1 Tax=Salirhabdus salicampi TaxID=476102 RepID=UPI0020C3F46D|nr:flagellar motor switch protein FliM [Salirhabdus salicampi]MCP8616513.1 flagellar motor switch protein FliM [Salirhabdus salicampi]
MSEDVLSQNEIDALLSALSTGEMSAEELQKEQNESNKKVRVYDFKRALRFSKDQIRGITRIHENFARILTTYLSSQLRTYVSNTVASVEQVPYEEFIRSIPKQTLLNVYSIPPLEGRILLEVNPNIAYATFDRLLGGVGSSLNKVDNLTEIETKLMTKVFSRIIESLREAWESLVDIDPVLEEFEVNKQFLQLVSPNETVVVISLNTTIGETSGVMNICIPHMVLEPLISKLSVHYWMQNQSNSSNPEDYEKMSKHLMGTKVEVRAILGESTISIEDLLHLEENDVIQLNQRIDQPMTLNVHDQEKFHVQLGRKNKKLAVQVIDEIRGEDHNE